LARADCHPPLQFEGRASPATTDALDALRVGGVLGEILHFVQDDNALKIFGLVWDGRHACRPYIRWWLFNAKQKTDA